MTDCNAAAQGHFLSQPRSASEPCPRSASPQDSGILKIDAEVFLNLYRSNAQRTLASVLHTH